MAIQSNDRYLGSALGSINTIIGKHTDTGTVFNRPRIRVYSGSLPGSVESWELATDPFAGSLLLDSMDLPTYDPTAPGIQLQVVNGEMQFVTPFTATATGTGTAGWFVLFNNEFDNSTNTTSNATAAIYGNVTDLFNLNSISAPLVLNNLNITSGNQYDFVQFSLKVAV